jgi:polyisoprenoid-binding protein YceI
MKTIHTITIALVILLLGTSASAAARSWEMDKAHSNIYFSVDHIFSKIHGRFNEFTLETSFDPENLAQSSFNFTIEVDTINTNITKRDKHLISDDFFAAGTYPQIIFKSKRISAAEDGLYNVAGTLTLKGKDYDLLLPLRLEGIEEHPAKKGTEVAGFNGMLTIDRLAHGVGSGKFYDMGIVGKEVDIIVSLELLSKR